MKDNSGKLRIGPAGNSVTFYEAGFTHTYEAPAWLSGMGLNAFEYSFGRGVRITPATAGRIRAEIERYGIALSVHAPYYTNLCNTDAEMIDKTIGYVADSIQAARLLGGNRTVFHPGAQGKLTRGAANDEMLKNCAYLMTRLHETLGFDDFILCPETLGKRRQMGTVEEVIGLCKLDAHLYPCFDFGHINSYTGGGLQSADDYRRIIDLTFRELGEEKTRNMHIHFSKIQYGAQGEIRHLDFEDNEYGPDYAPLARIIDEYGLTPVVICESKDYMADDALKIKACHARNL